MFSAIMVSNRRFLPPETGGRKAGISGASWTRKRAGGWHRNQHPALANLKPPSRKCHDDGIDGDGVARLYVYFAHDHIAFGAQNGFHFHRLDDAEGFA
jgi:hypothetical protein